MVFARLLVFLCCFRSFSFEDPWLQDSKNEDFPENIILFLASGMSVEAVSTTLYEIQKMENDTLSTNGRLLRQLNSHGKLQTYADNFEPGNLESGIKNIFYGKTKKESCDKMNEEPHNIISLAQKAGKLTGFITNMNVLSQVPPAFFGHEDCIDSNKSNLSIPSCLLENAKVNVLFGQHQVDEDLTQEDQASNTNCSFMDEETFVDKWHEGGFRKILFKLSDVNNNNLTADGNVLGLFPIVLKDEISTLINRTVELLKSNDKGYFLIVYLKHPNVLETVDLATKLIPLTSKSVSNNTLIILTSEYACVGDCLRKETTPFNDEFKNHKNLANKSLPTQKEPGKEEKGTVRAEASKQKINPAKLIPTEHPCVRDCLRKETTPINEEFKNQKNLVNKSLPTQKEPEKEIKDIVQGEAPKQKIKPGDFEGTVKNTNEEKEPQMKKEQDIEGSQDHPQNPVIESHKLYNPKEEKSANEEDMMTSGRTTTTSMLPVTLAMKPEQLEMVAGSKGEEHPQTAALVEHQIKKQPEKVAGSKGEEHPQTSASVNVKYQSTAEMNDTTTEQVLIQQKPQPEGSKAGILENEDKSISNAINGSSDSSSIPNGVEKENISIVPSTKGKRELNISSDVPIYALGPKADLFAGTRKQSHLWIFMKMSLCADEKFAGTTICSGDPVIRQYYDALFADKSMKGNLKESSAPGIFGKNNGQWVYLLLALVYMFRFYF